MWVDPTARVPLLLLGVVGVLSFNWNVLFPLLATEDLDGTATAYAALMGSMSVGSILGSLWLARRRSVDAALISVASMVFGIGSLALSLMPTLAAACVTAVLVGSASMVLFNGGIAGLQLGAALEVRGRVMAIFSMVVLGGIAIGGPFAGWVGEQFGARAGLAFGGLVAIGAGAIARIWLGWRHAAHAPAPVPTPPEPLLDVV